MVNVNQLDKDFKEILKGLTFEEIVTYYRSINKKLLETYPSSESMEWNVEEHNIERGKWKSWLKTQCSKV